MRLTLCFEMTSTSPENRNRQPTPGANGTRRSHGFQQGWRRRDHGAGPPVGATSFQIREKSMTNVKNDNRVGEASVQLAPEHSRASFRVLRFRG